MKMLDREIRTLILVNLDWGIKSIDLFTNLAKNGCLNVEQIDHVLLDMTAIGEIVEVEYIIRGKSRSFFLPKGTEVRIK